MLLFTEVEFTKIIFRMGLHRMRVKLGWQNLKGVDYNSENFNIAKALDRMGTGPEQRQAGVSLKRVPCH